MIVLTNISKYNLTREEIADAIRDTPIELVSSSLRIRHLDDETSEKLESCLLERFIKNLDQNGEPNNIGKLIDDLIGAVVSRNFN